jgi:prepilin-type N-terminal cleavage/methylation domain-containing protein/prepilin-type processing-associated H-X9-DG protein
MKHSVIQSAFTLVELLVVISVVALLVALLLPALSAARKTAQALGCSSNLRQVGIGIAAYTTDNHDNMFGIYTPDWNGTGNTWNQVLGRAGYWGATKIVTKQHVDNRYGQTRLTLFSVMECPGETPQNSMTGSFYSGAPYTNFTQEYVDSSFDMVFDIGDTCAAFWAYGGYDGTAYRFLTPTAPGATTSNSPIVMDNRLYNWISWMLPAFHYTNSGYLSDTGDDPLGDIRSDYSLMYMFRHPATSANALYLDFHVERKQPFFITGKHIYHDIWKGTNNHGVPYSNFF